ncbi:MAG: lipocalin family protein [Mycobacterium sp.]
MGDRRFLLGTGAVLVGMGSALLTTATVAAADVGDTTDGAAQASDSSANTAAASTRRGAGSAGANAAAGARRASRGSAAAAVTRPKTSVAVPAPAVDVPSVSVPAAQTDVAPEVPARLTVVSTIRDRVVESVATVQQMPAAATAAPSPAPVADALLTVMSAVGWGPGGAPVAALPAQDSLNGQRRARSAAAVSAAAEATAAPPDPTLIPGSGAQLPGYTNGVTGVQIGHSRLEVPGAFIGNTVAADWYFPTQADGTVQAQGVIWLQHGFGATNTFYSELAQQLAMDTNSIVVAPTLSSIPFTFSGGCLICSTTEQAATAAFLDPNRNALINSAVAAGYTGDVNELKGKFALAGHSAGGGFATAVASDYIGEGSDAQDANLVGVVMFDGVSNGALDGSFTDEVDILSAAGKPIYQIAAPAQTWNAFGATTNALVSALPGQFAGVVLTGGSHVDSMLGVNPLFDAVLQLVTQRVPAGNTAATYTLSTGWLNDMYNGYTPAAGDTMFGYYAGANQQIIMGPTAALALPSPVANQLSLSDKVIKGVIDAVGGLFGFSFPPPVNTGSNGLDPSVPVVKPAYSNGVTGVRTGNAVLDIPCGPYGYAAPADWYFPTQADGTVAPNGIIWLQHGFLGFNSWYADTAMALAQETNSIVVAPNIFWFDTPICPGCYLSGAPMREAVATMFEGSRSALNVSANAAGFEGVLPENFILTGHSAGGNFATAVGALIADPANNNSAAADLLGVVMFDGVSRAPLFTDSLATLTAANIPDYQIAAPPQRWNAYGIATELMTAEYPDRFNGVQIDNGSHTDVIGGDSLWGWLGTLGSDLIVKPSPPGGKEAVQTFATGWINDIYAGNSPYGAVGGQPLYGVYSPAYAAPDPYNPAGYNLRITMGQAGVTTMPAPPPVNVPEYLGKWYEQGSVRQFFSIGLVNTTATYSLNDDGSIKVENSGQYFGPNGPGVNIVGSAVPVNAANTRLDVGFFFAQPTSAEPGNYWILDYAPDYSWAIVGDPSGYSGYILTRDQFIPQEEYNALVARAQELGVWGWIIPTRQYPTSSTA